MIRSFLLLTAFSVMAASQAQAAVLYQSTFNSNHGTWNPGFPAATGTGDFWQATGGNPGGYVRSFDRPSSETSLPWFFENGDGSGVGNVSGNYSAAYGGTISFDMFSSGTGSSKSISGGLDNYDLAIRGNIGVTQYYLVYDFASNPTNSWSTFSATLTETSGWKMTVNPGNEPNTWLTPTQSEFQTILANLKGVQIRGDYYTVGETTGLDNFRISSAESEAVPEPATLAMWGVGALGCAFAAYRRRKLAT